MVRGDGAVVGGAWCTACGVARGARGVACEEQAENETRGRWASTTFQELGRNVPTENQMDTAQPVAALR